MQLNTNTVHVWTASLTINEEQAATLLPILPADERERANRFHFPEHRLRYIAAHAYLRELLQQYTGVSAAEITFSYNEYDKPALAHPAGDIQFNLSHSENMAVYAIGLSHAVGIDVEKVQDECNIGIADRYFSKLEQEQLHAFDTREKTIAFYRIWSRKEAVIKALGKGLSQPLDSFSVSAHNDTETITVDTQDWQIIPIPVGVDFQSALACHPSIEHTSMFAFDELMHK